MPPRYRGNMRSSRERRAAPTWPDQNSMSQCPATTPEQESDGATTRNYGEYVNRSAEVGAITQLVDDVPELQPLWAEHVADNGDPLPHVFFGDLSRFAVELAERGDPRAISDFAAAIERVAANPDPA